MNATMNDPYLTVLSVKGMSAGLTERTYYPNLACQRFKKIQRECHSEVYKRTKWNRKCPVFPDSAFCVEFTSGWVQFE